MSGPVPPRTARRMPGTFGAAPRSRICARRRAGSGQRCCVALCETPSVPRWRDGVNVGATDSDAPGSDAAGGPGAPGHDADRGRSASGRSPSPPGGRCARAGSRGSGRPCSPPSAMNSWRRRNAVSAGTESNRARRSLQGLDLRRPAAGLGAARRARAGPAAGPAPRRGRAARTGRRPTPGCGP